MNIKKLENNINSFWDNKITPALIEYIKIPNKSPSFDPDWEKHGHMETRALIYFLVTHIFNDLVKTK